MSGAIEELDLDAARPIRGGAPAEEDEAPDAMVMDAPPAEADG